MKKVRSNVKVLVLTGVISVAVAGFGNKYMTNAGQYLNASENNIILNVEKQDRDTVKIYLSNVYDLAKSIQLSVKIDDGNVTFNDSEIKWLVNADSKNTQKQYKINDKKNEIEFFIVSDEVINSEDGIVEICEIDVSRNESILNNLINSNNGSYRVVPNYDDKEAYSYVTYATNKRVGGNNIINASEDKLTINTDPVIKFRDVSSVINDKIIISKGTVFNVNDYVVAYDADGNEISKENVTYSGNIDNKKPGSYNIECKATDSYGDSSILKTTVIVEEETAGNVAMPVISGTDVPIEIIVGENFDLEKGITATDYRGRTLEVKISGDYDVSNPGTYTLTYSATDRFNNTVTATRTLIVKEKPSDPAPVLPPDNNTGNGSGSTTPGNGGSDSTPDNKYDIPGELVDIINNNIIPESGDGSVDSPLVVTASKDIDRAGFGVFIGQLSDKFKIKEAVIEDDSTYRTLKLTMSKKSSKYNLFNLFNSVKNSDEIYLHIKVDNSRSDLFDIMDSLKSHVDSSNSNGSGSNSSTGGSGSNGSTGGSGSNDSTGGSGSNGSTGGSGSNGSSGGSGSNGSSGGSGSNGSTGGSGSNGSTGGSGSNGSTGGSGSNGSTGGSGNTSSTGTSGSNSTAGGTGSNSSTAASGNNSSNGSSYTENSEYAERTEESADEQEIVEELSNDVHGIHEVNTSDEDKELTNELESDQEDTDSKSNAGIITAAILAVLAGIGGVAAFIMKRKK